MAAILLGEPVSLSFVLGGALVLVGVWVGAFTTPSVPYSNASRDRGRAARCPRAGNGRRRRVGTGGAPTQRPGLGVRPTRRRPRSSSRQSQPEIEPELVRDLPHVGRDRPLRDEQARRDLPVAETLGDERRHLCLSLRRGPVSACSPGSRSSSRSPRASRSAVSRSSRVRRVLGREARRACCRDCRGPHARQLLPERTRRAGARSRTERASAARATAPQARLAGRRRLPAHSARNDDCPSRLSVCLATRRPSMNRALQPPGPRRPPRRGPGS